MNLLFLGKPGSGKGTQANLLRRTEQLIHVSTGDMLREAKKKKTELGLEAYKYWKNGGYVPDDMMIKLMEEQITPILQLEKYLGDGYPRTIPQAEAFDNLVKRLGVELDKVILLRISDKECRERMLNRLYCKKCKISYNTSHEQFFESIEGKCNYCLKDLKRREDDSPENLDNRLIIYKNDVSPLENYYLQQSKLIRINANRQPFKIHRTLRKRLGLLSK
tara:strand:+ start:245 stop:904 length:660 start_codon:yes stop_codon:yes gene_type:complete